jgi:uncharacterized OB-fold protein
VWTSTSGRGCIYSFVIYHRAFHPAYAAEFPEGVPERVSERVPYAVALVELDEGVRLVLRVVDCSLAALAIGAPGVIRFTQLTEEVSLPVFPLGL